MRCRTTSIALLFHVPNRTQPLIEAHVEQGATIISHMFASYVDARNFQSHLQQLGFTHYFINHSIHYVDPLQNWLHTNTIENTWRYLKQSISRIKRAVRAEFVDDYLSLFMLKNSIGKSEFPFLI